MEQLIAVARKLRRDHGFQGYIHLKTIPEASPWLIEQAGLWADRLSINIELPREDSLQRLAPEKQAGSIRSAMDRMRERIAEGKEDGRKFSPAGQSTQVIVGADATSDTELLRTSATLYRDYDLRRVYYSAFSPIPDASKALPLEAPPLTRENRLYQADWLLRHYGFSVDEIAEGGTDGMLDPDIDPKTAWALKNRGRFPVDVNRAERDLLLRVPGLGTRAVDRIISARRHGTLRFADIARLTASARRVAPFIVTPDHRPTTLTDRANLRGGLVERPRQLSLFP
jgi:predicted DNA-binding helix-hairpin-helix protein